MQMVKGIAPCAQHTMFYIPPRVQDVQSMIMTGTNYGSSIRAGLNIPLLYICFNMHCIMAPTKTTNMAFQLQPPSSVGGSPQGAGGTWVLNWFVWLYFKCRIPPDVYSEGCFYRASFMGTQLLCSCWKTPLNFLYCNKAAKPVTQHNKQFEHLAFLGI